MFDEGRQFQAELHAARDAVAEHRRLSDLLDEALSTLAAARDELARATEALAQQTTKVHELRRLSPALILATLRGDRAARLRATSSEQEAAEARVAEAQGTVEHWERELTAVRADLDGLGDVGTWHAAALAAMETWAVQVGSPAATELRGLAKQAEALRRELAELHEVEDAVDHAGAALVGAIQHLTAARSMALGERQSRAWPFDKPFILSDGRKADEMDQAAGLIRKAGASLHVLSREFDELERERIDRMGAEDFLGTFDFLIDHDLNNVTVMDRIVGALDRVHAALGTVQQTDQRTERRTAEVDERLADLARRREELLMSL
ncbi:hypothetical protein [Promicromonospora sukumoe]|uniref:hypothetical protein n=1 Tax=Promicromonospora sukumoe TaxID=88382 RepID=UPI003665169C